MFFTFFFPITIMYIVNFANAMKKIKIFKKYYERVGFTKENSYYSIKRLRKRFKTICNQVNRTFDKLSKNIKQAEKVFHVGNEKK